ncbi:MAG: prepilin-type N-terminal cleavage/methylation domain-containing protein [Phycisphaerae bacterium]|nr:prepilin-type N-terminal cleavage/methylation domain-containing protein [Phycisphaerae bacterium]
MPSRFQPITPQRAFTLIELLVVISIISLLISILLPSLSRAREQGKSVHCLARLKEFGNAIAAYENVSGGVLPPARWRPDDEDRLPGGTHHSQPDVTCPEPCEYGWTELLFSFVYSEPVQVPERYPVQRNVEPSRWQQYFVCRSVGDIGPNSGSYRVYLPSWGAGTYALDADGVYGLDTRADPDRPAHRDRIRPKMPLIGDANELSERGDGIGEDDCSYIDAGEANYAGSSGNGRGNRFSDRHYGGTNFLFQDLHAEWSTRMRGDLAKDFDLNGIDDVARVP